jgi:hypothetical protein
MPTVDVIWEWVISGLVQNFVWVIVAILFVQYVQRAYENWKYGNWKVVVHLRGEDKVNREISPGKVKEILAEPAEMSVFVKGVASPYGWINCDVLTEGKDLGLFLEDRTNRRLVIDLDKNPKDDNSTNVKGKKKSSRKRRS